MGQAASNAQTTPQLNNATLTAQPVISRQTVVNNTQPYQPSAQPYQPNCMVNIRGPFDTNQLTSAFGYQPGITNLNVLAGESVDIPCYDVGKLFTTASCPAILSAIQQDLVQNGFTDVNPQLQPPDLVTFYSNNFGRLTELQRNLSGRGINAVGQPNPQPPYSISYRLNGFPNAQACISYLEQL